MEKSVQPLPDNAFYLSSHCTAHSGSCGPAYIASSLVEMIRALEPLLQGAGAPRLAPAVAGAASSTGAPEVVGPGC